MQLTPSKPLSGSGHSTNAPNSWSSFNNLTNPSRHSLFAAHVNAQSLPRHHTEVAIILSSKQLHALLISETWMKRSLNSTIIAVPGYQFLRADRNKTDKSMGGGVGMYVRDDLNYKILLSSENNPNNKNEFLVVELKLLKKNVILAVVYCPPKSGNIGDLFELCTKFVTNHEHIIIMGDFNCNLLNSSSHSSRTFSSIFQNINMKILPQNATHYTRSTETWIDRI